MDITTALEKWQLSVNETERLDLRKSLAAYLNQLITEDFSAVLQLLYRVDVSEQKLTSVLAQNTADDSGNLIADLLIQREMEKLASRQQASASYNDIPDDERW